MSVKAKIIIDDEEINALWFSFGYQRHADVNGRPTTKGVFLGLRVAIESRRTLNLAYWAFAPNLTKEIELHISSRFGEGRTRKLKLYDCHLLRWDNRFTANGSQPMHEILHISAGGVKDNNSAVEYSASWRKTFDMDDVEPMVLETPTPEIKKINWIHPDTKENIKETSYNENVSLLVEIENHEVSTATITITKKDGTEFKNGQKEFIFQETVDEDGVVEITNLEIKEQWEDFKTSDIDELIATVEHDGVSKKSSPLTITPPPKVIVDFRPAKKYKGEYGIDFMRDKKEKGDTITYKDILGESYYYDTKNKKWIEKFTKYPTDKKYNELKNNYYKTITFPWYKDKNGKEIEYIQNWLAIYPKQKVKVSLQINTIDNPKKLDLSFKYDKALFKLSIDKIVAQNKGKIRLNKEIEIECLKEFDTEQKIKVMYQNRQLGQLNILKNDKKHRRKAEVVFVRVETELEKGKPKSGKTSGEKTYLKKYLKQALVRLELPKDSNGNPKDIVFDLTEIDPKTKKLLYPDFNKDYTLLSPKGNKVLNKYNNTKGGDKLVEFMEKKFNKKHPVYKDHYKVFIFGDGGGKNINKKYTGLGGYAKAINSKAVVAFDGRTDATITHETLHAIGLHHTFSTDKKNPFSYKKGATYNIMDYSHLNKYGSKGRILTWLWQWNFLWSKLPKE